MSFTRDLKLPIYEEVECPMVNVISPGSVHLAKYCDLKFKEFMLCQQIFCDTCNDTFTICWTCLDNAREGEMSFNYCREEQKAFGLCAKNRMNLERPEPSYFSMIRMHDSKRSVPSDPFRIGSLKRHPPKLEVPDSPSLSQADEYSEAKIGMKFEQRKSWMFESKLRD